MNSPSSSSWPLDTREHLAAALREQDASPAEIDAWAPIAQRLTDWPAHAITPADTQRLLAVLTPLLPQRSAVRHAVREHYVRQRRSSAWLLDTARVQVGIMRPTFWLASATVTLLGAYLELASWDSNSALFLHALGPLLAYLGISAAFRSSGLRTVECELACPPSPIQLALARVVLVLGYDAALGLCLSIVGWLRATHSGTSFLAITLHWLMPLLLVAGLALVLSLRLRAAVAAGLAYSCWLAAIALYYSLVDGGLPLSADMTPPIPSGVELTLGLAGLALLTIGILRFRASVPRLLPSL